MSDRTRRKVVTLDDLARHAGVSRSTVSLVLRGSLLPAATTRERVLEAVKALGYVYNRGAASLRSRQTMVVGMVVGDIANPFFADMVAGAQSTLDEADRVLLLVDTSESHDSQERYIARLREHGVDGLLVCAAPGTEAAHLERIRSSGTPIVEVLRRVEDSRGDFVGIDFEAASIRATEHLIELGHRRIAFIGGDLPHSAVRERHAGFASALSRHGLEPGPIVACPVTRQAGYEAASRLLQGPEPPTAAVAYSDRVAFGVMAAAHDRGLRVGRDFALVGFDDLEQADVSRPTLTSIATRPQAVGREAARVLVDRMQNPDRPSVERLIQTELMVRQSSAPPEADS
ncbi:MAG TPA: LacI family DNA-binding transcriptional regulator [Trueperaceae bacterium]